jgi:hypothetical protein
MWEYLVVPVLGEMRVDAHGHTMGLIDDLGVDGWELVTVTTQHDLHMAYFKRKVEDGINESTSIQ